MPPSIYDISYIASAKCNKFRALPKNSGKWDISGMTTRPDINAIREKIWIEMEAKGFNRRSLALTAGLSQTAVRDILGHVDNPGIGTLSRIAEALHISFDELTGAGGVRLSGNIGAGGAIAWFPDENEISYVPRPPLASGPLMALRVTGDSMLPKYEDGDVIYVPRSHDGVLPQYMGKHCAVHTADGGTYLKILSSGSAIGRYTLRSLNAADMENVEVIWAAPVVFIMPRPS